jgi:hypothetical protein
MLKVYALKKFKKLCFASNLMRIIEKWDLIWTETKKLVMTKNPSASDI